MPTFALVPSFEHTRTCPAGGIGRHRTNGCTTVVHRRPHIHRAFGTCSSGRLASRTDLQIRLKPRAHVVRRPLIRALQPGTQSTAGQRAERAETRSRGKRMLSGWTRNGMKWSDSRGGWRLGEGKRSLADGQIRVAFRILKIRTHGSENVRPRLGNPVLCRQGPQIQTPEGPQK